jgi:hypothetical protein
MRHRIDISIQAKTVLKEIGEKLGISTLAEMCVQSAYENMINGECLRDELNPTQKKLDEILILLREVLPEI